MIGALSERIHEALMRTQGSVRRLPFVGRLSGMTPMSPLHLFDMNAYRKAVRDAETGVGIAGYLSGRSLKISGGGTHKITGPDPRAAKIRRRAAMAGGGLLGAELLGIDPFGLTSAGEDIVKVAAHAGIAATLMNMGGKFKLLGMGYLGLAGMNLLNEGDQVGPF